MQLDKLVHFHKALGDATRIRIIILLKNGPLHGLAIADRLGLRPPTITHHISKLRDTGMVYARREKNTIYFHLDERKLSFMASAIMRLGEVSEMTEKEFSLTEKEKQTIVNNFVAKDGKLKQIPSQLKKKLVILAYFVRNFEIGKVYDEKEVNEYIKSFHEDYATIRREWIMQQFMYRENNRYELNPVEMWPVTFNE
ncbi:metalloregulator ArsR/SmtB family transcription factor [Thalassobacillus pellis]|uniref:DUF2087 domain-containing protein n=1 Tax=Thalassobacillus pellis TaxID=748008 RepID=UPI001960FCB9|nr:metalloregulator ArsR/SmtB family transcription factor [Thalassobacillus pellis]MBM7553021.1 hypothetical protein [Thalassobacillus pellis]